ncbi:MAG: hypothetical protein GW917_00810 [Bdellovibrionales bacterium]|nr:hypothetical protein [Bdellovibrionales bacterium]
MIQAIFTVVSLTLALPSYAKEISSKKYISVKYGYKQLDELYFVRSSKRVSIVEFVDRDRMKPTRKLKRAFPAEIVDQRKQTLIQILSRLGSKIESPFDLVCTSKFIVGYGSSYRNIREQSYCLDRLSENENRQISDWIQSLTRYFQDSEIL